MIATQVQPGEQPGEQRDSAGDAGFTLIEVLISLVLGGIIAGVTVAAMLTSMNVIDVTSEQISGSTDTGLVASFFYRDAQAAGGTLPSTGQPDPSAGVSVSNSPAGWHGCAQPGTLVVRFSWTERVTAAQDRDVVVTYGLSGTKLTRRICVGASASDLVVGENIASAEASCQPDAACGGSPDRVSLRIVGVGERVAADHTLSASLRQVQASPPDSSTTIAAPLVVLGGGGSTPCPPLRIAGVGDVVVLGDAVVADGCGSSLVGGNAARLQPTGVTSGILGVSDPLATLAPPSASCAAGTNPTPLGASPGPISVVVHPQPVVVTGPLLLQPGRYVFCDGLTLGPGAVVEGSDVTLIVLAGGLQIDPGARADLTAPTTGELANVLFWSMSADAVSLEFGSAASILNGLIYAPDAPVSVTTGVGMALGGLVARSVTFDGDGTARLGLPISLIGIAPATLPTGDVGVPYPPVTLVGAGGTAPYTFTATGLPNGMTVSSAGVLSGTPAGIGTFSVAVTVVDDTGAAATVGMPITIVSAAAIVGPATLADGQVGTTYPSTTMAASGGVAPLSWSASGLPAGLSMSSGGVLSGTPTATGPATVVVTLTDGQGTTSNLTYTLNVGGALAVSGPMDLYAGQVGLPYSAVTMVASGGSPPYLWSATGLPPGLTMSFTGDITGTPTTAGTYAVVAYTSDSVGTFATRSYSVLISAAAPAPPAGCPASPAGWLGEYYANLTLTGPPTLCRDDAAINFAWNGASPGVGVAGTDFSVRWSRTVNLTAGTYEFMMGSDDGGRLYIDGALVMDDWVYRPYASRVVTQLLGTGPHNLVMEYFQGPGQASATLDWTPVVPAVCPTTVTGWLGEYFRNRTLTGPATLCRDDATVNFNWGTGTPGAPITSDDFSVRWTRTQSFTAGTYAFQVGSDDGARLYIDGALVGDWWYDTSYVTRTVNRTLTAGTHTVVMEFYERGGLAHATLTW